MSWQISSIMAALFFAVTILLLTGAGKISSSPVMLMIYLYGITLMLFVIHAMVRQVPLKASPGFLLLIGLAGLACYGGNYFQTKAITSAPNSGYAVAIIGTYAVLVALASVFLFGTGFSLLKALGVAACVAGVVLISI